MHIVHESMEKRDYTPDHGFHPALPQKLQARNGTFHAAAFSVGIGHLRKNLHRNRSELVF
ncbi:hypothetical protein F2981_05465 [Sinorhizobium meliloti]|nr:hypothetical protein [Sinorhizobium meliloti]